MTRILPVLLLLSLPLLGSASHAQVPAVPSVPSDTGTISDSTRQADSVARVDAVRRHARISAGSEHLLVEQRRPIFSFSDSLRERFCSERYNQKPAVDRSFFRSAADYFRYAPQFFVLPYLETPLRTTVAPFGLSGNRLNWVSNQHATTPFEYIPGQDGMVDAEDFPTTTDDAAYVVPGPFGLLLGGDQATATLVTRPKQLTTTDVQSVLYVDKGWDDYSQTRGRFDKLFGNGRRMDLSIAYRKGGGFGVAADDAYHYSGHIYVPIGARWAVQTDGWLYNRNADLLVPVGAALGDVQRNRLDRHAWVSLMRFDSARSKRTEITYEYLLQKSHLDYGYRGRFDQSGHGLSLRREWTGGRTLYRVNGEAKTLKYDNGTDKYDRFIGELSLAATRPMGNWQTAFAAGSRYQKTYKTLPFAVVTAKREAKGALLHLSFGYAERAPTLMELYLPYQQADVQLGGAYADSGNGSLVNERQLVASIYGELGTIENAIGLTVATGRLQDAIDWVRQTNGSQSTSSPANVTVTFTDVSATARLRWADFARFSAGGGYHQVSRADNQPRYYSPKYQAYTGLDLHWFWSQKLIHFYGYGELVYTGPYQGYVEQNMGDRVVANGTLAFRMGQFRMNFMFRNLFGLAYDARDNLFTGGRFFSYGFVWNFVN